MGFNYKIITKECLYHVKAFKQNFIKIIYYTKHLSKIKWSFKHKMYFI